ncbi:hypothetical protein JR316_0005684 [Psilocybe cubensis]|uniref:Uncharacterized protein n=2 Tax=Psilocybe cubensis TaxID=181762 RepID=A0A8H7XZS3_PSICU|nr:hypothetical protein JR316_0005684 [Psilocybe cubensis]KAH9481164.1 hypothetical protein JR316_0005684 [Psilocybe cubensis]
MSSLPRILPYDVIADIVDIIACPTTPSSICNLKLISLVNTMFLHHCRKYLFGSISLDLGVWDTKHLDCFVVLINNHPHIANYVRELCFTTINKKYEISPEQRSAFMKLSNLKTLTLCSKELTAFDRLKWRVNWRLLESSTRSMFVDLIQSPTLANLVLNNVTNFNVFHLLPRTALETLSLVYFGCPDLEGNPQMLDLYGHVRVKEINVDCDSLHDADGMLKTTISRPSMILDFEYLKTLKFRFTEKRSAIALEMFRHAKNLNSVCLYLEKPDDIHFISKCVMPSIETLTSLKIVLQDEGEDQTWIPLREQLDLLSKVKNGHNIKDLELVVVCKYNVPESDWHLLERILLKSGWTSTLRRFTLRIHVKIDPKISFVVPCDTLRKLFLPKLAALESAEAFKTIFDLTCD